ncbi:MAG: DUF411 domain-containing protein [Pseudomonadota bacterium]|nr:DUF411 domain-containing protein [Pseudomonadota bacterium]
MKKPSFAIALAAALSLSGQVHSSEEDKRDNVQVHKSPTCGCCDDWVKHMEDNGFDVQVTETNNLNPVKSEAGLTPALASCHTARVGDYVIEGHVPASDVRRLLANAPMASGLAVPGMPAGSPGMEMGDRRERYQVLLFNEQGQTRVFSEHD